MASMKPADLHLHYFQNTIYSSFRMVLKGRDFPKPDLGPNIGSFPIKK